MPVCSPSWFFFRGEEKSVQIQRGRFSSSGYNTEEKTLRRKESNTKKSIKQDSLKEKIVKNKNKKHTDKSSKSSSFMIGANAAGISNKVESLENLAVSFSPIAIFIQEAKMPTTSKIELSNYLVYSY